VEQQGEAEKEQQEEEGKADQEQHEEEERGAGQESQAEAASKECGVCLDDFPEEELHALPCHHLFCKTCWHGYLALEFDEKRRSFLDITCPAPKCSQRLSDKDWRKLASPKTLENYDAVLRTVPEKATCFRDFNYAYDEHGVLRNTINNDKFHWVSQMHYDALGDFVVEHIQHLLKQEFKMEEVLLPIDAGDDVPRNNIFLTPGALEAYGLLVIIQGSGAVRPGQWARALCINDSLEMGTIFPYLRKCQERGWGAIVLNPNQNSGPKPGTSSEDKDWLNSKEAFLSTTKVTRPIKDLIKIPGNETPSKHTVYVWDHFCRVAAAPKLAIVAHSAGGACTMGLLRQRGDEVLPRCVGVAFTDSVHSVSPCDPAPVGQFIREHAINWVTSDKPLDTPECEGEGCPCLSAGHTKHEWTSGCCVESVFKFLDRKFAENSSAIVPDTAKDTAAANATANE